MQLLRNMIKYPTDSERTGVPKQHLRDDQMMMNQGNTDIYDYKML